jgi:two-component system chemotaxis response regulator CheY
MRSAESQAGLATGDRAKIIMTTALTSTNSMVEAIFDGDCNDYLVKPVTHEYLREILQRYGVI